MTDEELVRRWQHGDRQAFDELYERFRDEAYRTACLITGNRADGEDLAQEAFVQCALHIGSLKDGAKFRPWLMRLLSRSAWKYCKKRRREQPVCELFETGEGESALSAVIRSEEQRALYKALLSLDEARRTVTVLYYFNDLSVKEIAQATGTFDGTVKSRLHSARRMLRQALTTAEHPTKEATI